MHRAHRMGITREGTYDVRNAHWMFGVESTHELAFAAHATDGEAVGGEPSMLDYPWISVLAGFGHGWLTFSSARWQGPHPRVDSERTLWIQSIASNM